MCNRPDCNLPAFICCSADDVELVALLEKVIALNNEADVAQQAMDAIQPEIDRLAKGDALWRSRPARQNAALKYAYSSGWQALCTLNNAKLAEADEFVKRMWAIPATSAVGRQAKVKALYVHCVHGDDWHGEIGDHDWGTEMARRLLAEFAGLPDPKPPAAASSS
jgi:hypothetical protein